MSVFLWIIQWALTAIIAIAGLTKLYYSKEKLLQRMGWVEDYSQGMIRTIGLFEFLSAVSMSVISFTSSKGWIVVLALGIAMLMLGAAGTHARRDESKEMITPLILFVLAIVLAVGRSFVEPF